MKQELFTRFEKQGRGDNDLKKIEEQKLDHKKKLKYVLDMKEGFENTIKEERELINTTNENERLLVTAQSEAEDKKKLVKNLRAQNVEMKASLAKMEAEIGVKEAEYDKQLNSGKKVENLQNRHFQRAKELESLQTIFVDLEEKKDELQMQLMNKTQEVKDVIASINDMVKKITLNSSVDIKEFPQFDILDFHKKHDLIKQYKEQLQEIRTDYNANVCKLPEQLSQCREEFKLVEGKIASLRSKIASLESQIASREENFASTRAEHEEMYETLKQELVAREQELSELEKKEEQCKETVLGLNKELRRTEEM